MDLFDSGFASKRTEKQVGFSSHSKSSHCHQQETRNARQKETVGRAIGSLPNKNKRALTMSTMLTLMSQLGRIQSLDRSDPRFLAFLQALATMIEERGLPWIQTRSASNIIHAIGKMQLRNPSTKSILEWISKPQYCRNFCEGRKST